MYGTQAFFENFDFALLFENDVKMYGTQAILLHYIHFRPFENDVKMYGTQAIQIFSSRKESLRMM